MPTPEQSHGPLTPGRDGWSRALLALTAPATRLAARGPQWQPVHATNHDAGATWWELVTRPLWGLAAYAAGGGKATSQWDEVRCAISAAVDPRHPWYIGPCASPDQRIVESAAVGYALAVAPHELWDGLTGPSRDHLAAWLSQAASAEPVDNNWHFFPVLAAQGLRRVGVPVDEGRTTAHLDRIEDFALAGGWYGDGAGGARDYYIPFGFHFYGLVLAGLGHPRGERYRERASAFARQFRHWFAADGSALPFGRSLGYRFAQGAFWSALAAADVEALPWAESRGLAERHLSWWWRRPILHGDGLLSVGYAYPNTGVVEQYMAGGSPYWSTKVFAALAVAADHPFWTADAAPSLEDPGIDVQPSPSMIVGRSARGDVVALNGQPAPSWNARGRAAKYAKFAYSTLAGISVPTGGDGLDDGGFDSTLALSDDGEHWRARTGGETEIDGATLVLRWSPWPDVHVVTRLWHDPDGGHLREHVIRTGRRLWTAEGGFSAPHEGGLTSAITCLHGGRETVVIEPMPGGSVLFPRTVLPMLRGELEPGEHRLLCRAEVSRVP